MPAPRSFTDDPAVSDQPNGILYTRTKRKGVFEAPDGTSVDVKMKKVSLLTSLPCAHHSDGRIWQLTGRGRIQHSADHDWHVHGNIRRHHDLESPLIRYIVSDVWSLCEFVLDDNVFRGTMEGGKYGLRTPKGATCALSWEAWKDSDLRRGHLEFFWYDGHSFGEDWPAAMLLLTKIGDVLRSVANPQRAS